MIQADLSWLASVLEVEAIHCQPHQLEPNITNINTDSRTINTGDVFVALSGPNFNGNKFVAEVKEKGAIAAVVSEPQDVDMPQFVVADTKQALGVLGAAVAAKVNAKTIAITGSVGKTSVKEMCAAILAQCGEVLATKGNFNNDIGAPLTLLRLEEKHQYAVIELGANHLGEIDYTVNLTKPDVAVLNNVAQAHLEGFGGLQGVVKAKGEIFNGLNQNGIAIVNGDSEHKDAWLPMLGQKLAEPKRQILQFSYHPEFVGKPGFICAQNIRLNATGCASFELVTPDITESIQLNIAGKHNVKNALAATAACMAVGAEINHVVKGLASMAAVKGRVNLHSVAENLLVIDDSYNANVQSVKAAIELLSAYQGFKILALGDMGELGDEAEPLHREVGVFAKKQNIDSVLTCGELSKFASQVFGKQGFHFHNQESILAHIRQLQTRAQQKLVVLVKGSRSAKMEVLVQQLSDTDSHSLSQNLRSQ